MAGTEQTVAPVRADDKKKKEEKKPEEQKQVNGKGKENASKEEGEDLVRFLYSVLRKQFLKWQNSQKRTCNSEMSLKCWSSVSK